MTVRWRTSVLPRGRYKHLTLDSIRRSATQKRQQSCISYIPISMRMALDRMKILYASATCSKHRFSELFFSTGTGNIPGQQVQKFHRLMMDGLASAGVSVVAITSPPINAANNPGTVVTLGDDFEDGIAYQYLPILNIRLVKHIFTFAVSFIETYRYLRRNSDAVVVCDVLNFSVATGALLGAKALHRSNTGIVTDLPRFLADYPNRIYSLLTNFVMRRYDSYVLLTKQMSSVVNRHGAPEVVIEGLVDSGMTYRENEATAKKHPAVCLYAGALDRRYGVDALVQGFLKAHTEDAELWIFGHGDYVEELEEVTRTTQRVKFFGVIPNEAVVEEQLSATLLVNPRPTWEEFTKFSFPSKNMEYMASGTPLLTTRLPGMPTEYIPYVYLLEDETPTGIANALEALFAQDRIILHKKGAEAKQFVLLRKNNTVQARRLLQLIEVAQQGRAPHLFNTNRSRRSRTRRERAKPAPSVE